MQVFETSQIGPLGSEARKNWDPRGTSSSGQCVWKRWKWCSIVLFFTILRFWVLQGRFWKCPNLVFWSRGFRGTRLSGYRQVYPSWQSTVGMMSDGFGLENLEIWGVDFGTDPNLASWSRHPKELVFRGTSRSGQIGWKRWKLGAMADILVIQNLEVWSVARQVSKRPKSAFWIREFGGTRIPGHHHKWPKWQSASRMMSDGFVVET